MLRDRWRTRYQIFARRSRLLDVSKGTRIHPDDYSKTHIASRITTTSNWKYSSKSIILFNFLYLGFPFISLSFRCVNVFYFNSEKTLEKIVFILFLYFIKLSFFSYLKYVFFEISNLNYICIHFWCIIVIKNMFSFIIIYCSFIIIYCNYNL